ncbi:MAG TPA: O-antigen polymerase [Steroidobacteraceae bacterium]|nr:O-antigen polymerase [Steroidobacteraceae bacterium]
MISGDLALSGAAVALIGVILYCRYVGGGWRSPVGFLGATWAVAALPALMFETQGLQAAAYVLCAVFLLGTAVGYVAAMNGVRSSTDRLAAPANLPEVDPGPLRFLIAFGGCCGLAAVCAYVVLAEERPSSFTDLEGWLAIPVQYSVARYGGDFVEPIAVRLLLAFNYAASITSGLLIGLTGLKGKMKIVSLPLVASCLVTLLTTAKAPMLIAILGSLAGYLAARVGRPRNEARKRSVLPGLLLGVLLAFIAVMSMVFRYGMSDDVDTDLLADRLIGYFFGHMYALSAWCQFGDLLQADPQWGRYTFAGVFEAIGVYQREAGMYSPIALSSMAEESNVFTVFRGVIHDYTLAGAVVFFVLIGYLCGYVLRLLRRGTCTAGALTVLTTLYLFFAWSPIVSVVSYNVIILGLVLVFTTLRIAAQRARLRNSVVGSF